jgi:hypothetical protein
MRKLRQKPMAVLTLAAVVAGPFTGVRTQARDRTQDDRNASDDSRRTATATPIKHVIVIIGENRTFDNVYGTYVPKGRQQIANLLSRGIVNPDGTPGWNAGAAEQSRLASINPVKFFVDTNTLTGSGKAPYAPFLPTPETGSAPAQPVTLAQLQKDPAPAAPPFDRQLLDGAAPYDLAGARAQRSVPVDQRRDRARQLHRRPDGAAVALPAARHAGEELRRAAQHGIPDHQLPPEVRQLHGRHGAPLLSHVAAV